MKTTIIIFLKGMISLSTQGTKGAESVLQQIFSEWGYFFGTFLYTQ